MNKGQVLWGLSNGVLILGISGAFWLGLGMGPAAYTVGVVPWLAVLAVMLGGAAAFVRSSIKLRQRAGFTRSDLRRTDPQTQRIMKGLRGIILIEFALCGTGAAVSMAFHRPELLWPAIALGVSIHFAPMAKLFAVRVYYLTSSVGTLVSIAALCLPLGRMRLLWLGTGMATVMWCTALYLMQQADAIAARSIEALAERNDTIEA